MIRRKKPVKDLPSGVGVTPWTNSSGTKYWRVRLGKRFTGGPVILKDFHNLEEVRKWVDTQKDQTAKTGEETYALSLAHLADARQAIDLLAGKGSLSACVKYWLKHAAPKGGLKTWKEVAEEFLVSRRAMGCKPKTLVQYESYLRVIGEEWNDIHLSSIKRQDIEDWLSETEWSGRTRKNYLVTLTTVFSWAMDREYCGENPAGRIERPILDDSVPGILTPAQAKALLRAAATFAPEMVVPIAIGLFAGLRRSEICSLDWSEIDLKARHIEVKGIKAKTRQRRLVAISENLLAWLKPRAKESGPVAPSIDAFSEKLKLLVRGEPKTESNSGRPAIIAEWPHNALRHSFGSYFFATTKNENLTAAEMGNSPGMVFKHYRAIVKEKETQEYWRLRP